MPLVLGRDCLEPLPDGRVAALLGHGAVFLCDYLLLAKLVLQSR
jgi:hypothetical protein